MQTKYLMTALLALVLAMPAVAANEPLAEGKYMATLSPSVDEKTADKIESELGKVKGIGSVDVEPEDSSLHFTVKKDASITMENVTTALNVAAPSTTVGEPMSEDVPDSDNKGMGTTGTETPSNSGSY